MRGTWTFLLILAAAALAAPVPARAVSPSATEAECPAALVAGLGTVDCFTISVPERHDVPDGREISLFVSILRSTSAVPSPDPVVYLAGGPGAPAIEVAPLLAESTLRATRDVILLEQRGTALADPYLG